MPSLLLFWILELISCLPESRALFPFLWLRQMVSCPLHLPSLFSLNLLCFLSAWSSHFSLQDALSVHICPYDHFCFFFLSLVNSQIRLKLMLTIRMNFVSIANLIIFAGVDTGFPEGKISSLSFSACNPLHKNQ